MTTTLKQVERIAHDNDATTQSIRWNPAHWLEWFEDYRGLINEVASVSIGDDYRILRSQVYERALFALLRPGDEFLAREAFLVIMIWGRGRDTQGPAVTYEMFESKNFDHTLFDLMSSASAVECDPAASFGELFTDGRPRIDRLGVSFGTKVLHAFGNRDIGLQPLVYDNMVHDALFDMNDSEPNTGLPSASSPQQSMQSADYGDYCEWACERATEWGVAPRDVEYALFTIGQALKNEP